MNCALTAIKKAMEKIVKLLQADIMTQKQRSDAPLSGTKKTAEAKWYNDHKRCLGCQTDTALDHVSNVDSTLTVT